MVETALSRSSCDASSASTLADNFGRFSIAICTRGDDRVSLLRAIRSALVQSGACDEVIVVDQGNGLPANFDSEGLDPIRDERLVHVRDTRRGVSRARNKALELARNDVVVFTDDDCEFGTAAAEHLAAPLLDDKSCSLSFGTVFAKDAVNTEGFIPTYVPPHDAILRGRTAKLRDGGIGAAMACRKSSVLALGGFDERFGPGSEGWLSCEEGELAFRVLKAGFAIAHRPNARIMHHGRRRWDSAGPYTLSTFRGIGAAYGVHAWRGDSVAALLLGQQFSRAGWAILTGLCALRRPSGMKRLTGLAQGILSTAKTSPLDSGATGRSV